MEKEGASPHERTDSPGQEAWNSKPRADEQGKSGDYDRESAKETIAPKRAAHAAYPRSKRVVGETAIQYGDPSPALIDPRLIVQYRGTDFARVCEGKFGRAAVKIADDRAIKILRIVEITSDRFFALAFIAGSIKRENSIS